MNGYRPHARGSDHVSHQQAAAAVDLTISTPRSRGENEWMNEWMFLCFSWAELAARIQPACAGLLHFGTLDLSRFGVFLFLLRNEKKGKRRLGWEVGDTCASQVPDKSVRQTDRQTVNRGGGGVGGSLRQEEIISLTMGLIYASPIKVSGRPGRAALFYEAHLCAHHFFWGGGGDEWEQKTRDEVCPLRR